MLTRIKQVLQRRDSVDDDHEQKNNSQVPLAKNHSDNIHTIGKTSKRLLQWLYSFSLVILLIVFLGLNSAIPIDSIVKSSTSHNLAVNAIIIVIECALFLSISTAIYIIRIILLRFALQDIPKAYIPTSSSDIPKEASDYIHSEIARCEQIRELAGPNELIRHPGLHHSEPAQQIGHETIGHPVDMISDSLPNNLIYENVVRSIGEEIKYNGYLILDKDDWFAVPQNKTLRTIIETLVEKITTENRNSKIGFGLVDETLKHYEYCRFSGKPITYEDFLKFIRLWYDLKKNIHENSAGQPLY